VLVTVAAFREPYEAHLFRGRLEAEGIVAFVSHEYWIGNEWPMSVAFGGVKVQVSSDEYRLAREIERACCGGEFKTLLQQEIGDLDDAACPHCGGTVYCKRRPFPRAALAVAVSMTLGTVVPPAGWIHRCERCRKEYRAPHRPVSLDKCVLTAAAMAVFLLGAIALLHWIHKVLGCPGAPGCL